MLPTFVIGLREGLEATLIVSIIATFLRSNRVGLRPMWIGLGFAVALAAGVGVALNAIDQSLPQRGQEGLATVIAAVAVFFVTSMIVWMRRHARFLKRDLEAAAGDALGSGTATAMGLMVFLSVLREGFETSVFLLSTFQASTDPRSSAGGAVLGLATSVAIGYAIYRGGVRLNLTRFFKVTGVFLVFVAAGLVLSALRTAHATGWIAVGQGTTVDLAWLAPPGSIRTALVSGVLGIPPDPRQIELFAWAAYLIPMLALTVWPAAWRMPTRRLAQARAAGAVLMAVAAGALVLGVPMPATVVGATAPLRDGGRATVDLSSGTDTGRLRTTSGASTATWTLTRPVPTSTSGADTRWTVAAATPDLPSSVTAAEVQGYGGGRVPVGLDLRRTPGPFSARWSARTDGYLLSRAGGVVDARADTRLLLTLSEGGLTSSRVISVDAADADADAGSGFAIDTAYSARTSAQITAAGQVRADQVFWKYWVPVLLLLGAGLVVAAPARALLSRTRSDVSP